MRASSRLCLLLVSVAVSCKATTSSPPPDPSTPSPPDVCTEALFCDDFEAHVSGQLPGAPWSDASTEASVQVDTTRARSGDKALHVALPADRAYRRGYVALHGDPVFPAAAEGMFGRLMVWLDSAPNPAPGDPPVHWTLIQGEGRSADDTHNALYRYGGQHQGGAGLMANYETTPPTRTDCWKHSASTLPTGAWVCLEWHFARDRNEMELWMNGQALDDLHVTGSGEGCLGHDVGDVWQAPAQFQSLYLGWERYQTPTDERHVWIDDVAIGLHRLGCP